MLFGRKTYQLFAGHWPDAADDPVAERMNSARKHLVSSTTDRLAWNNSEAISGNIAQKLAQLKKEEGLLIHIHGSWELVQFLLAERLIDQFRLWTFPTVVGSGKRLFERNCPQSDLTLIRTEACSNGVVMNFYRNGAG